MTKPMSPDEVADRKTETIPDDVFEVVNAELAEKWTGNQAIILQKDIVHRVLKVRKDLTAKTFPFEWLDFEDSYRALGWEVEYDKPGYNETYSAKFIFRKVRKK
jgi:hypothetical protein